jgi:cysteine-rich repeat protein
MTTRCPASSWRSSWPRPAVRGGSPATSRSSRTAPRARADRRRDRHHARLRLERRRLLRGQRRPRRTAPGRPDTSTGTTDSTSTADTPTRPEGPRKGRCRVRQRRARGVRPDVPEECDDGNLDPDDGCSETCALDRRVFVTSVLYQAGRAGEPVHRRRAVRQPRRRPGLAGPAQVPGLAQRQHDRRARPLRRGRGRLVMVNGLVLAVVVRAAGRRAGEPVRGDREERDLPRRGLDRHPPRRHRGARRRALRRLVDRNRS